MICCYGYVSALMHMEKAKLLYQQRRIISAIKSISHTYSLGYCIWVITLMMYNKIERCFCSVYGRDFSCHINTDKRCRIYLYVDATVSTTQLHSDLCKSIIPAFRLSCLTARPPSLILSDVVCTHLSLILLSLSLPAEIGDFEETQCRQHLLNNNYIPDQMALMDKIMEFHHKHV